MGDEAIVEIEEHFENYQPPRQRYERIVFAGGRVLRQEAKAGQGHIRVHLRSKQCNIYPQSNVQVIRTANRK